MNNQPAYVTREEFERRMRVLEGDVEGEKLVTRHILEQTRRNGDDLATLKTDSALMRSELTRHSALLNVLTQDVTMVRQQMTALSGEVTTLRGDLTMLRGDLTMLRGDFTTLRGDLTTLQGDMATVRDDVAAIRAALAPHNPPGQ